MANKNTCVEGCPSGFYSFNDKCLQCTESFCLECRNNVCTSCEDSKYYFNTKCYPECPAGSYLRGFSLILSFSC